MCLYLYVMLSHTKDNDMNKIQESCIVLEIDGDRHHSFFEDLSCYLATGKKTLM